MLIKLCGRQIYELTPGARCGLVRLSRGMPQIAHVLYEGPASLEVQYAVISRTPTARPLLGNPIRIAGVRFLDHTWPSYELQRHLHADGSLVVDTFILELFDEQADERPSVL